MKLEPEDFDRWLENPVTELVMAALKGLSEAAKQKWIEASWVGGDADPILLVDLRARAEVIDDLVNLKLEDIQEDESEPERNISDRV